MNQDFPPLDDELRRMLANAREGGPVPQGAEARVRRLLAASLPSLGPELTPRAPAGAGPQHAVTTPAAIKAGSVMVAVFLAGGVAGASLHAWLAPGEPGDRARVQPSDPPAAVTAPSAASEPAPLVAEVRIPDRPAPMPSSGELTSDLGAERALLDRARRSFGQGNAVAALSAIAAHSRRFPNGRLHEEREALAVKALVAAARYPDARARADKFRSRYPDSILSSSVEAAVQQIP